VDEYLLLCPFFTRVCVARNSTTGGKEVYRVEYETKCTILCGIISRSGKSLSGIVMKLGEFMGFFRVD